MSIKNVILFGAGASYGSPHILPENPPLGSQLYEKLSNLYPDLWGTVPDNLKDIFRNDFEQGILNVIENNSHWISPLMQSMALFFCSYKPDSSREDSYSILLQKMATQQSVKETLFSTLNYECILELAGANSNLPVDYNDAPTANTHIKLWKLHGSCNFIPDQASIHLSRGASFQMGATFNPNLKMVTPVQAAQWVRGDTALYPAMCLFTLNKPSQISPHIFQEYQRQWGEKIGSAEKVFIIGVRPHEVDSHIWIPIQNTNAEVNYIGSRQEFDNWLPKRSGKTTSFLGDRFHNSIDAIIETLD